jgi:hypothetical protein
MLRRCNATRNTREFPLSRVLRVRERQKALQAQCTVTEMQARRSGVSASGGVVGSWCAVWTPKMGPGTGGCACIAGTHRGAGREVAMSRPWSLFGCFPSENAHIVDISVPGPQLMPGSSDRTRVNSVVKKAQVALLPGTLFTRSCGGCGSAPFGCPTRVTTWDH